MLWFILWRGHISIIVTFDKTLICIIKINTGLLLFCGQKSPNQKSLYGPTLNLKKAKSMIVLWRVVDCDINCPTPKTASSSVSNALFCEDDTSILKSSTIRNLSESPIKFFIHHNSFRNTSKWQVLDLYRASTCIIRLGSDIWFWESYTLIHYWKNGEHLTRCINLEHKEPVHEGAFYYVNIFGRSLWHHEILQICSHHYDHCVTDGTLQKRAHLQLCS